MRTDVFVAVTQRLPSLSPAERRLAEKVLEEPSIVVSSTISALAAVCDTSQATVARFCKTLGFSGYKEFRMAVASAISREETSRDQFRVADADISPDDSALEVVTKVAYQEARAIEETARSLDLDALDAAVAALRSASRIEIFGVASSGLTAQDLHLKLHRIGLSSYCWVDTHLALTSVALARPGSVAIGISHSGLAAETNEVLQIARRAGAMTIALTNFPHSPIGETAELVLATSVRENRFRSGAMSSRIAQMALVDFLVVRLLQGSIDTANEPLRATYDAVQNHRLDY
ncbi:MurR/RpiR family transcriptional regulator [Microbacterium sp. P04]|uniref:MurR/RpiR family transcriptional regulator n=1 Tax=Microbacterium sp. P04 TaxID=3366947 RepID=UPI00374702B8